LQLSTVIQPDPVWIGTERIERVGLLVAVGTGALLWWLCRAHPARLPPWAPWEFDRL
jgi:hypothetical protein